ncbi:SPAC2C4.08 [Scenedesmus sp. PABB004]|nr:SPAC2C4.08 [Scenedesmus sp. PABB004]
MASAGGLVCVPFVSVGDLRRACMAVGRHNRALAQAWQEPAFFLTWDGLGFFTGVDRETWQTTFLLTGDAALRLLDSLEARSGADLHAVRNVIAAAARRPQHVAVQRVSVHSEAAYKAILGSMAGTAKQARMRELYNGVCKQLADATAMARPVECGGAPARGGGRGGGRVVHMFLSLDFEWWEKSSDIILEVGWSLWDTATRHHRTRHWVVKENLNKCNGRFIADNRMRFAFGMSQRGSVDAAMNALQAEVDARGITDGLSRAQREELEACEVVLVLVGHGMSGDLERAELLEIEWPPGMPSFDTQQLYLAWQLRGLDPASAAKALEVAGADKRPKADDGLPANAAAAAATGSTHHALSDAESDDPDDWVAAALDDHPGGAGGAAAGVAALSLGPGGGQGGAANGKPARVKGKPQPQMPKRVRPWPHGPAPEEKDAAAAAERQAKDAAGPRGVERQAGLANMLTALGIRSCKMHNAGNDSRFTLEAFLAMAGHPACPDPEAAHLALRDNDEAFQRDLERSLAAAAAQGFTTILPGTPGTPGAHARAPAGSGGGIGRGGSGGSDAGGGGGDVCWDATPAPIVRKQPAGRLGAHNSSTDTAQATAAYADNPDGW